MRHKTARRTAQRGATACCRVALGLHRLREAHTFSTCGIANAAGGASMSSSALRVRRVSACEGVQGSGLTRQLWVSRRTRSPQPPRARWRWRHPGSSGRAAWSPSRLLKDGDGLGLSKVVPARSLVARGGTRPRGCHARTQRAGHICHSQTLPTACSCRATRAAWHESLLDKSLFRVASSATAPMIFIAAACVVATTTVVVSVAVATRVHELVSPSVKRGCGCEGEPPSDAPADESAGCTAHLLHLYQQA